MPGRPRNSWAWIWSMCASPRSTCRNRFRIRYSSACARAFKAQAAKLRAEGVESSERTRADANKQQTEILAEAARQAGQIRGQGDASASEVYARSYSKNAEFYSFYRSMQSYREAVGTQGDVLVIAPDNAYFKYFNKSQPQPPPR